MNNMSKKPAQSDKDYFIKLATKLGADHAVVFKIEDIVFDPRTILKCMFGCSDWGKGHTCPSRPGSLKPWEYRQVFEKYSWGIIIHSTNKKVSQDVSLAIEKEAFLKDYYFAFSLSDCALCEECAGHRSEQCVNPKKARPALQSVGIDVFKTSHQLGLPLKTLKEQDEEQNWYSAVFIE
jgi:predicted metal-binding protein